MRPVVSGNVDACKFCKLRPLCRVTDDLKIDKPKIDTSLQEWAERIRKESGNGLDDITD